MIIRGAEGASMRIAVSVLAVWLAGCGMVQQAQVSNTRSSLSRLEVGMTKAEVIAIMGEPRSREAQGNTEFLISRTELTFNDRRDYADSSFTPVVIVNGRVAGWARNFYDDT